MFSLTRCPGGTLALVAALTVAAPSAAPGQTVNAPEQTAHEQEKAAPETGPLLRPGDMVRLQIWREPDLSGDFPVNVDGVVVFPLIGPVHVTDESLGSLRSKLIREYRAYLTHESIEVLPLRRVNVLGAVRTPGLFPVDETMTIADALALAGGTTPQGDPDRVELVRGGERITSRLSQGTRIGDLAIRTGDQLFVPERSWFSRNANVVSATISASVSLVIALFIRR